MQGGDTAPGGCIDIGSGIDKQAHDSVGSVRMSGSAGCRDVQEGMAPIVGVLNRRTLVLAACLIPVIVGGLGNRGVVAAASYEAREFGIHSAMPVREALRRCPRLLRVKPRMAHYRAVSERIFEVFRAFTPLVEGLSLDEAFLDVTASAALFGLWHVLPALGFADSNAAVADGTVELFIVPVTVVVTAIAGAFFAWTKIRSSSLIAPTLVHASMNSSAVVAAWLVG